MVGKFSLFTSLSLEKNMIQFCTRCKKQAEAPEGYDLPRIHGKVAHPSCWVKAVFEEEQRLSVRQPTDYPLEGGDVLHPHEPD
jgi:hypothetical protein